MSVGAVYSLGESDARARRHPVVWRKGDGFEYSSHLEMNAHFSSWSDEEKKEFAASYVAGYAWGDQKAVNLPTPESLLAALRAQP